MKNKNNTQISDQDRSDFSKLTHTEGVNQNQIHNQNQNPMHKELNLKMKRSTIEFVALSHGQEKGLGQDPGPATEIANIASSLDSCDIVVSKQKRLSSSSSSSSFSSSSLSSSSLVLVCSNLTGMMMLSLTI